jgi:hypothetical protein
MVLHRRTSCHIVVHLRKECPSRSDETCTSERTAEGGSGWCMRAMVVGETCTSERTAESDGSWSVKVLRSVQQYIMTVINACDAWQTNKASYGLSKLYQVSKTVLPSESYRYWTPLIFLFTKGNLNQD